MYPFPCRYLIRAKTREKDTYIEFSIAESLENKGKLRKLIDNSQFVVNIYILLFRKKQFRLSPRISPISEGTISDFMTGLHSLSFLWSFIEKNRGLRTLHTIPMMGIAAHFFGWNICRYYVYIWHMPMQSYIIVCIWDNNQ